MKTFLRKYRWFDSKESAEVSLESLIDDCVPEIVDEGCNNSSLQNAYKTKELISFILKKLVDHNMVDDEELIQLANEYGSYQFKYQLKD